MNTVEHKGEILPIRLFPDPILRKRAHPIESINAEIAKLARDMVATLMQARGVGLAAPQVGVSKRLAVIHVPESDPMVMINPAIVSRRGKRTIEEGCLSVPGYTGLVTRAISVSARYLDLYGDRLQLTAEELLAQAIEHEIDHLNGIMYLDHLKAHQDLAKTAPSPGEPHWHDVEYRVHVHHGEGLKRDKGMVEVLKSVAKLSQINSESGLEDAAYDLTSSRQ